MDIDPPPPGRQLSASALGALAGRQFEGSIVVDWMWDSLKLGDGGEYGEQWGSMHERFDRGINKLLQFYQQDDMNGDETVVILVTHGAGCNALLGALTRKPVLTDIPISSLSMAVLRPSTPSSMSSTSSQFDYDLLLQAETQHLSSSSLPSISSTTFPSSVSSHSRETSSSSRRSPIINDKRILEYHPVRSRSASSTIARPSGHLDLVHRHPSLKLRTASGLFGGPKSDPPRTGLWAPTSPSAAVSDEEEDDELLPAEVGARRKRAAGLWRSWAGEQNRTASMDGSGA